MPLIRAFTFALAMLLPALASAQVARVLGVQGTVALERAGESPRIIATGQGLEQQDVVTVAQASNAILEFRDKTRVTLRPNTVFRVESYADSGEQSMVLGLTKGGFRAVSGDIAKQSPTAMRVRTNTTILGVRGTEFDARICEGDCAADDTPQRAAGTRTMPAAQLMLAAAPSFTQEAVTTDAGTDGVLPFGHGIRIAAAGSGTANVDPGTLGKSANLEDGLYVWVRSGLVLLGTLEIPAGQVGRANSNGFVLLAVVPNFMRLDPTPPPLGKPQPEVLRIFRGPDGTALGICIAN